MQKWSTAHDTRSLLSLVCLPVRTLLLQGRSGRGLLEAGGAMAAQLSTGVTGRPPPPFHHVLALP
jgi:hypothetical protein